MNLLHQVAATFIISSLAGLSSCGGENPAKGYDGRWVCQQLRPHGYGEAGTSICLCLDNDEDDPELETMDLLLECDRLIHHEGCEEIDSEGPADGTPMDNPEHNGPCIVSDDVEVDSTGSIPPPSDSDQTPTEASQECVVCDAGEDGGPCDCMMTPQGTCCPSAENDPNYDFANYYAPAPGPNPDYSVEAVASSVEVVVDHTTVYEDSDSVDIIGTALYSKYPCVYGEPRCLFYLADLRFEATSTIEVSPVLGDKETRCLAGHVADCPASLFEGTVPVSATKDIENLSVELVYPILAESEYGTPSVVDFEPGRLVFLVRFDLSGDEWVDGIYATSTNDYYEFVYRNETHVTATVIPGTDTFLFDGLSFDIDLGTHSGTLNVDFDGSITAAPPVASSTSSALYSTVHCTVGSYASVNLDSSSSDPDNDISTEFWMIDGSLAHVGNDSFLWSLNTGVHDYELFVFDSRFAYRRKSGTITVVCP